MSDPRILFIDIETTPNIVHAWGLYNQNIALNQIVEPSRMLCFAAKFKGDKKTYFSRNPEVMIQQAHFLMSEADVIVHFNGNSFDIPILNSEFAMFGLNPPTPSKHIDLYRISKKNFRFPSHKLAYISKALGLEGKVEHSGHSLWTACMAGDRKAWQKMKQYNIQDVDLLEELYDLLLPWIPSINLNLFRDGMEDCPRCGSHDLRREGFRHTATGRYQRFQCRSCGGWCGSGKRDLGADIRAI